VLLQQSDGVDVQMVEEVCVGRPSIGTLVFHQVVLQGLLTGVALLHHEQLRQKEAVSLVASSICHHIMSFLYSGSKYRKSGF